MDKIVTCITATLETKPQDTMSHGDKFSLENLKQMQETIDRFDINIFEGFDTTNHVGTVLNSFIKNDELHIICEVKELVESCYIVPGFQVIKADYNEETDIFKYLDIELICMGATMTPSDVSATKFKEVTDG